MMQVYEIHKDNEIVSKDEFWDHILYNFEEPELARIVDSFIHNYCMSGKTFPEIALLAKNDSDDTEHSLEDFILDLIDDGYTVVQLPARKHEGAMFFEKLLRNFQNNKI